MTEEFEEIVETFEFLDEWEDRYRHVIELGKAMEPLDEVLRVPATKVDGCASQVWLVPQIDGQGPEAVLSFSGDSDAMIVRGLIAILKALLSGVTLAEVAHTDASAAFAKLGLDQHLSAQRSNGLRSMIARIKTVAAHALAEESA
ncbi:MAG: SufE family protein [Rhodobacteraceae bacterium]|nr:SufE family protein [Paracoccaceae bacterium]